MELASLGMNLDLAVIIVFFSHFLLSCLYSQHPTISIYRSFYVSLCFPMLVSLFCFPLKTGFLCAVGEALFTAPDTHFPNQPTPAEMQSAPHICISVQRKTLCLLNHEPFLDWSAYQAYSELWVAQSGSYNHPMTRDCWAVWLTAPARLCEAGKNSPREMGCCNQMC